MSRAGVSLAVFGGYLIVLGLLLAAAPNAVLGAFGFPPPSDPWVHVLGCVVFTLGGYYVAAARQEVTPLFGWSVRGRAVVFVAFGGLVAAGIAPPMLALFGTVDLAAAAWTHLALRADAAAPR
jgi:hypothetical protein